MAMDMDSGIMRMLQPEEGKDVKEQLKVNEQLFEVGEYLSIKGCVFSIQAITPEVILLKPESKNKFTQRL